MNEHEQNPRSHLDDETLAAYVEGALSAPEREAADAHLADCGECRSATVALAAALAPRAESSVSALPVPAGLSDRILARIPLGPAPSPALSASRKPEDAMGRILKFAAAALAASLLFVVGLAW